MRRPVARWTDLCDETAHRRCERTNLSDGLPRADYRNVKILVGAVLVLLSGTWSAVAGQDGASALVAALSAESREARESGVARLARALDENPRLAERRDVHEAVARLLRAETAAVHALSLMAAPGDDNEDASDFYYATLIPAAMALLQDGRVAAESGLLVAMVDAIYNTESPFAVRLAREGTPVLESALALVDNPNAVRRGNGYDLLGQMLKAQRVGDLRHPLSAEDEWRARLALRGGLRDVDEAARFNAMSALITAGDTVMTGVGRVPMPSGRLDAVLKVLSSTAGRCPDRPRSRRARQALVAAYASQERAWRELASLVDTHPDLLSRADVQTAVVALLDDDHCRVSAAVAAGGGIHGSEIVNYELQFLALALLRTASPDVVTLLVAELLDGAFNTGSRYAQIIATVGEGAVPPLLLAAGGRDIYRRSKAYDVIGFTLANHRGGVVRQRLTVSSERSLRAALLKGLRDADIVCRREAVRAVVRAGDRTALPTLEWLAANDPDSGRGNLAAYSVRGQAIHAVSVLTRDERHDEVPGRPVRGRARHDIHRQFTIEAPPSVAVRPYMSERPMAAFVAHDLELQVVIGNGASVPAPGARVLLRKTDVVDGRPIGLVLRRNPAARPPGWTLELEAHIADSEGDGLHASARCADEAACAVAERMLMSIEFPRTK